MFGLFAKKQVAIQSRYESDFSMSKLTGDALAAACARAMYARDKASQQLGMVIEKAGAGYAELSMPITASMLNGHAICHGGFIFTLADSAFAFACNSRNRATVAQQCRIEFKQPAKADDRLTAVAEHQSQDGRYGQYKVTVKDQDDAIIACFYGQSCEIRGEVLAD